MYKIYINSTQLVLCDSADCDWITVKKEASKVFLYRDKQKYLLHYIDMLEKNDYDETVIIHSPNYAQLKSDFKGLYKTIIAAGGLVINEKQKGLFIFKRGVWDLPKGKLDFGEAIKEAAVREVMEETGLNQATIISKLCKTKHTFTTRSGNRAIKKTYWYLMNANKQKLTPQTEEGIEKVAWLDINEMLDNCQDFYGNLEKVLKKYKAKLAQDIS